MSEKGVVDIRLFVPAGGRLEDARLQKKVVPISMLGNPTQAEWRDVSIVYEDPDDEVVECPRLTPDGMHPEKDGYYVCRICLGQKRVKKSEIRLRQT